ncbi:MAG: hypothetical protein KME11_18045 [Timaviella obliquedivisa GSE-PSE-MK23-08B]|jgi:hypothetical protein|nr:hypothetical protein [Timaviella obliquedivisa GSE-PSE-MK23-08B]
MTAMQFITFEVALQPTPAALQQLVLAQLQAQGQPLRWAITAIAPDRTATVEAVVII